MASDKSISSRLLTMKFMQRGIVNSPSASPAHQRSSKRQRVSDSGAAVPRHSDADIEALQAAIADEAAKRAELMERVAAEKGDTRWVLSVQERPVARVMGSSSGAAAVASLNVAVAGFADIDEYESASESGEEQDDNDGDERHENVGRRSYGQASRSNAENDNDFDEDSNEEYDPSSIDAMIAEAQSLARKPASQHNSDRMPTSISGGGGSLSNRNTPKKSFKCYQCGAEGHIAKLCPNR